LFIFVQVTVYFVRDKLLLIKLNCLHFGILSSLVFHAAGTHFLGTEKILYRYVDSTNNFFNFKYVLLLRITFQSPQLMIIRVSKHIATKTE